MGAWGIKALESDEGLDVIDFLTENYLPEHTTLKMEEIISALKGEGFFGETFEEIDFFYDHTALTLAELYVEWLDTGKLDYDDKDEETVIWSKVSDFTVSRNALDFLLRYLYDIRNEVPDEDDEREIVELWKDSNSWEEWSNHLDILIQRLEQEQKK